MLTTRIIPHAVHLITAGSVDQWINQIEAMTPESQVALFEETSGSETDRAFVAAKEILPTLPIITTDLTILSTVGFAGVYISPGSGTPGLVAYGRELPQGGLPTAIGTGNHISLTISDGLIVPVRIQAGHNTLAKLSLMAHAILGSSGSSGATPFVWASAQTITSGAGGTANEYCAGPVKWTVSGGSSQLLQGIKQSSVDFGIGVMVDGSDSEVYSSHVSIPSRMSRFEFSTADAKQIAAIGDGIAVSAFAAYFRNIAADAQRTGPATTSHIKISSTAGMITPGSVNLTHKRGGETQFIFTPRFNTALLTISVAAAIPTS